MSFIFPDELSIGVNLIGEKRNTVYKTDTVILSYQVPTNKSFRLRKIILLDNENPYTENITLKVRVNGSETIIPNFRLNKSINIQEFLFAILSGQTLTLEAYTEQLIPVNIQMGIEGWLY